MSSLNRSAFSMPFTHITWCTYKANYQPQKVGNKKQQQLTYNTIRTNFIDTAKLLPKLQFLVFVYVYVNKQPYHMNINIKLRQSKIPLTMIIGKKKIISKANVVLLDCWLASPRRGVRQFQLLTSIINSKYCSTKNTHVEALFSNFWENIPLNICSSSTRKIPNRLKVPKFQILLLFDC